MPDGVEHLRPQLCRLRRLDFDDLVENERPEPLGEPFFWIWDLLKVASLAIPFLLCAFLADAALRETEVLPAVRLVLAAATGLVAPLLVLAVVGLMQPRKFRIRP